MDVLAMGGGGGRRSWRRWCTPGRSAQRGFVASSAARAPLVGGAVVDPEQPAYDRPFELRELYESPRTGAEHYVVRYRAGTKARWHRHTAAHTIIVVAGELVANGQLLGPGGYAHFPGGTAMLHEPADEHDCTFVLIFDGPFDLQVMASPLG